MELEPALLGGHWKGKRLLTGLRGRDRLEDANAVFLFTYWDASRELGKDVVGGAEYLSGISWERGLLH